MNKSRGAGNSRFEPANSTDFFPTPPWGARALIEHVMRPLWLYNPEHEVWEPACGSLHMARPLSEYYTNIRASDIEPRGDPSGNFIERRDFINHQRTARDCVDWIITNPPINLFMEFFTASEFYAKRGIAMLAPLTIIEGLGRYEKIYKPYDGRYCVAPFVERLPIIKNRVSRTATTAQVYAWPVVSLDREIPPLRHIPPCRKELEKDSDYD